MFAGGDFLGFHAENRFGLVARIEELPIDLAVGDQVDPLDPVARYHRVWRTANRNLESTVDLGDDRDVFVRCRWHGLFFKQRHWLATMAQR